MSMDAYDFINRAASSNCCGAAIIDPDICAECGEHCEDVNDENYDPTLWCNICGAKEAKNCNCPPISKDD